MSCTAITYYIVLGTGNSTPAILGSRHQVRDALNLLLGGRINKDISDSLLYGQNNPVSSFPCVTGWCPLSTGTVEDPDSATTYVTGPSACRPTESGGWRVLTLPAPPGLSHTRELWRKGAGKHQHADEELLSKHLAAVVKQQGNH